MTGTIAQQLALISYGNAFLNGAAIPDDFYPTNSTFQFCKAIIFTRVKTSLFGLVKEEVVIANDPFEWLTMLKNEGCERLELYYEHSKDQSFAKDHMLAGFVGGGGTWAVEAIYADYKVFWLNSWMVTNENDINNNVWTVKYGCSSKAQYSAIADFDLDVIKRELESTLISIRDFAVNRQLDYWASIFNQSLTVLNSAHPVADHYKDMVYAASHSHKALQILFSASQAFVFGGMGSWNDMGFEENLINREYETLSEALYRAVINSFKGAINQ